VQDNYLGWLVKNTKTTWWNDGANADELRKAIEDGATGVTSNPFLVNQAVENTSNPWFDEAERMAAAAAGPTERAESLVQLVVTNVAQMFLEKHRFSNGTDGYVCAQVNPLRAHDRDAMQAMAKRFGAWAPNIAVKLPACRAGLEVLSDCISEGITVTATVSFSVPQVIAIAEHYRLGIRKAEEKGKKPGKCFAVIMIGRVDDHLKEVARDNRLDLSDEELNLGGLAITKRAFSIYQSRGYEARLLVAALRGVYHMTELAGADLTMSIHPKYQGALTSSHVAFEEGIHKEIPWNTIERLRRIPDFVKAYDPDGLKSDEFYSYSLFQRTLTQFVEAGWGRLQQHAAGKARAI